MSWRRVPGRQVNECKRLYQQTPLIRERLGNTSRPAAATRTRLWLAVLRTFQRLKQNIGQAISVNALITIILRLPAVERALRDIHFAAFP